MSCESYPSSAVKLVHGAHRLVTPVVSRLTSQHFGCRLHSDVFGPMLQTLVIMSSTSLTLVSLLLAWHLCFFWLATLLLLFVQKILA